MIKKIISFLKEKEHQKKSHQQFQEIQKWQDEMYLYKTVQELYEGH